MNEILVVGHKNPDTDSICSAYCYARLKNIIGGESRYVPARCGNANRQTKYVFERLGVRLPDFFRDVHPRVADVMTRSVVTVDVNDPVYQVLKSSEEMKIRITPVVSEGDRFRGVVSLVEISDFYFSDNIARRPVYRFRAENFQKVLRGSLVRRGERDEFTAEIVIGAMPFERSIEVLKNLSHETTVLIVGKRREIIGFAIEKQIPALVITGVAGEAELDIDFSGYRGWVFLSGLDTAETYRRLVFSAPAKSIMNASIPHVAENDYLEDARDLLLDTEYRGLPVLDDGRLVGIITRSDLIKRTAKRIVLMDHNELGQAIDGAEGAEICEIVDHHRLGTIRTRYPIYVYAKPVGSTCTLVYQLYRFNAIGITPEIASLLLAGILSDTAILKSPTTTREDREAVKALSELSGLDHEQFGIEIFSSTESLAARDADSTVGGDFKVYEEFGVRVGIGQAEVVTLEGMAEIKPKILASLEKMQSEKSLQWAMLLVSDIVKEDSVLITTEFRAGEKRLRYARVEDRLYSLPGVLSRKKQLLPEVLRVLEEAGADTKEAR